MENIRYPVYFNNNTCVHCGKTNCLRFKDKYGNIVTKLIYSATKIVCSKCGTEFDIKWIDKNGKMFPVAVDDSYMKEFENDIIEFSLKNRRKI